MEKTPRKWTFQVSNQVTQHTTLDLYSQDSFVVVTLRLKTLNTQES